MRQGTWAHSSFISSLLQCSISNEMLATSSIEITCNCTNGMVYQIQDSYNPKGYSPALLAIDNSFKGFIRIPHILENCGLPNRTTTNFAQPGIQISIQWESHVENLEKIWKTMPWECNCWSWWVGAFSSFGIGNIENLHHLNGIYHYVEDIPFAWLRDVYNW